MPQGHALGEAGLGGVVRLGLGNRPEDGAQGEHDDAARQHASWDDPVLKAGIDERANVSFRAQHGRSLM